MIYKKHIFCLEMTVKKEKNDRTKGEKKTTIMP